MTQFVIIIVNKFYHSIIIMNYKTLDNQGVKHELHRTNQHQFKRDFLYMRQV